jgi:DNA repair photolyase
MHQPALFSPAVQQALRQLPVIGEQRDITYYALHARSVLNGPGTTGMGFWSINPYTGCAFGCAYCYARYAHRYVMERAVSAQHLADATRQDVERIPPWLAFERHILVKRNAAAALARVLRQGSERHAALAQGEGIVIGTATDPYQPAERRFRITRDILEVLAEHAGLNVVIITKSPLVTRDVDLLARIARRSALAVHLSLITLDRSLARRVEPRAPTPESRLRAITRLHEAGVNVGVNCMPVLPGITDDPRDLEALVRRVADAGAHHLGSCALRLQHEARKRYLPFIAREFPHLAERYERAYANGYALSQHYRSGLESYMTHLCRKYGIQFRRYGDESSSSDSPPVSSEPVVPARTAEQLALAL